MRRAGIFLLLATLFWAWSFIGTKVLMRHLPPLEAVALRVFLGAFLLILFAFARKKRPAFSQRDRAVLLLCGGVLALHFTIQFTGLARTTATNTGWIIAVVPISTTLLARVFLKERVTSLQIAGMVIASGGIVLLLSGGSPTRLAPLSHAGDWLVLGSTFTWAAYTVLSRDISRRHGPLPVTAAILTVTAVVAVVYMGIAADWSRVAALPAEGIGAAATLAVFSTFLAFWFWQEGVAGLGAARAGYFLYFTPVATSGLALLVLGERFGWSTLFGAILVTAGVILAEKRRRESPAIEA
jgi:drug/metabolite transporter (DMT)-like permease